MTSLLNSRTVIFSEALTAVTSPPARQAFNLQPYMHIAYVYMHVDIAYSHL